MNRFGTSRPLNPVVGDKYLDHLHWYVYIYNGKDWIKVIDNEVLIDIPSGWLKVFSKDLVK